MKHCNVVTERREEKEKIKMQQLGRREFIVLNYTILYSGIRLWDADINISPSEQTKQCNRRIYCVVYRRNKKSFLG